MTKLYDRNRLDLLRALKAGTLNIAQVYDAYCTETLNRLTGDRAKLDANLWVAVEAWVPGSAMSAATRDHYALSFKLLMRSGVLGDHATVGDLEHVDWVALHSRWAGGPGDWNHLGRAVSYFLALYLLNGPRPQNRKRYAGHNHPLRMAVVAAFPSVDEPERVPDLPREFFLKIVDAAPAHARAAFWTIAALGLRVGGYLRLTRDHLLPHSFGVQIPGTKTAESRATLYVAEALWPWVLQGVPSPLGYKCLRLYRERACKAVGAPDLRLHDLRHLTAQLLVNAMVSEAKVQTMMRHATPGMTRRYARQRDRGEAAAALGRALKTA